MVYLEWLGQCGELSRMDISGQLLRWNWSIRRIQLGCQTPILVFLNAVSKLRFAYDMSCRGRRGTCALSDNLFLHEAMKVELTHLEEETLQKKRNGDVRWTVQTHEDVRDGCVGPGCRFQVSLRVIRIL